MNYWESKNFIKKHNAFGKDDKIGLQKTVVTTFCIVLPLLTVYKAREFKISKEGR
jgi:trans-2-enoyl-CoA reductase